MAIFHSYHAHKALYKCCSAPHCVKCGRALSRPAGLPQSEEKPAWHRGWRKEKAPSTPVGAEVLEPHKSVGQGPFVPKVRAASTGVSDLCDRKAGMKSERHSSGISRLDGAVSKEACARLQCICECFGKCCSPFYPVRKMQSSVSACDKIHITGGHY